MEVSHFRVRWLAKWVTRFGFWRANSCTTWVSDWAFCWDSRAFGSHEPCTLLDQWGLLGMVLGWWNWRLLFRNINFLKHWFKHPSCKLSILFYIMITTLPHEHTPWPTGISVTRSFWADVCLNWYSGPRMELKSFWSNFLVSSCGLFLDLIPMGVAFAFSQRNLEAGERDSKIPNIKIHKVT